MKNILRLSKIKIILNIFVSSGIVLAIIFLPSFGFSHVFNKLSLGHKITSFLLSWIIGFIIYYPFVSSLAYLASCVKNSIYRAKEIILALILIAVFNPLSISLIGSKILLHNETISLNKNICGLRINEIMAGSKMKEAGIKEGDIIMNLDEAEIKSVQDIFNQLDRKKPGDKVNIETSRGLRTVELARDANDPNHPVLGAKLTPSSCEE